MKIKLHKIIDILLLALFNLVFASSLAQGGPQADRVPGQYLVKFTSRALTADFRQMAEFSPNNISKIEKIYTQKPTSQSRQLVEGVYKITVQDLQKESDIINNIRRSGSVEYIEPNYLIHADLVPNDPKYSMQWALEKIEMPTVWKVTQGSSAVVVAVVDSGVDYDHPDLAQNIRVNSAEIPNNGIDDDHNGFMDDYQGYDFSTLPSGKQPDANPDDDFGHGSHVAGIIGAVGNNAQGIAGMNWAVKIIPVKILDSTGTGTVADAAAGIYYAVNSGAKIINCSWGFLAESNTLKEAVKYAVDHNVLVVASAGNFNWDSKQYPAAYDGVIGVAALDRNDKKAAFSNFGSYVDIAAPGVEIYSTSKEGGYRFFSGTSQACPLVAGAAALLKSYRPEANANDLWQIIKNSAKDIVDPKGTGQSLYGWDQYTGYGRVDILAALKSIGANVDYSAPTITIIYLPNGAVFNELTSVRARIAGDYPINTDNMSLVIDERSYRLPANSFNQGNSELEVNLYRLTQASLANGHHQIKIIVEDIQGNSGQAVFDLNLTGDFRITEVLNFPNPVGSSGTYFSYTLTEDAEVTIKVFNTFGRLVKTIRAMSGQTGGQTGFNKILWNATDENGRTVSNDVYYYVVISRNSAGTTVTAKNKLAVSI